MATWSLWLCAFVVCCGLGAAYPLPQNNSSNYHDSSLPFYRAELLEIVENTYETLPTRSVHAFVFLFEPWINTSVIRLELLRQANQKLGDTSLKELFIGYVTLSHVIATMPNYQPREFDQQLMYRRHNESLWQPVEFEQLHDLNRILTRAVQWTDSAVQEAHDVADPGFADSTLNIADHLEIHFAFSMRLQQLGQWRKAAKHNVMAHALVEHIYSNIEALSMHHFRSDLLSAMAAFEAGLYPDVSLAEFASLMLENALQDALFDESDPMHAHLSLIRALTQPNDTIVEIGVRQMSCTLAFLASHPAHYIAVDLFVPMYDRVKPAEFVANALGTTFEFIQGDVLEVELPSADVLMLDSLHSYSQLRAELARLSANITRFIFIHGTAAPWSQQDEVPGPVLLSKLTASANLTQSTSRHRGVWPAIVDFLASEPGSSWMLWKRDNTAHGLTVLRRQSTLFHRGPSKVLQSMLQSMHGA